MATIEDKISKLYDKATKDAAKVGASTPHFDPEKPFDSANYPSSIKQIEKITDKLASDIQITVENGVTEQWDASNAVNNELCHLAFGPSVEAMTGEQLAKYFNNHTDALAAFLGRTTAGMGLSGRVWNLAGQFQEQIEMAIDLGLRDGVGAARMSTTLKQYLNDPDKLFRRVRDQHGVLRLSKAAKSYHPGQGRYRSSHKNAMRLARTEVNMAYRTADYLRIQDFDFVVGIEVHRSNNPYPCPLCDALAGRYPKDFKFVGWHPQCRCYTTTIQKDDDEFWSDWENDTNTPSKNAVTEPPKGFSDWVQQNKERIERAEQKGTLSYFLRDNKNYVDNALKSAPPKSGKAIFKTDAQKKAIQEAWDMRRRRNAVESARTKRHTTRDVIDIQKRWDEKVGVGDKILQTENDIRKNAKFETAVLFDTQGRIKMDKRGKATSVSFTSTELQSFDGCILTHNHPRGWAKPEGTIGRIGNSFSPADLNIAVNSNLKEVRAVTPTHTFTMTRPDKGWGVSSTSFKKQYKKIETNVLLDLKEYIANSKDRHLALERASALHYHIVSKRIAEYYGWSYKYGNSTK